MSEERDVEGEKTVGEAADAAPPKRGGEMRETIWDMGRFALIALFVTAFIIQPVRVDGVSMSPRLHDGERILINKFLYPLEGWPSDNLSIGRAVERGDIVVFFYPNDPNVRYVKRVIGVPGDEIRIDGSGGVFVNDKRISEPYLASENTRLGQSMAPVTVKDHYYFVMGDNRDNSSDSRAWGLVPEKYICGEAVFRFWPLGSVGTLGD